MQNFRLSRALCTVVGEALAGTGSHATLEALFISSGAPDGPPDLAHHSKWKEWLFRSGQDSKVDSLAILGNVLEEFMDVEPLDAASNERWTIHRERVVKALEAEGLRYFSGGRVLPSGAKPLDDLPAAYTQSRNEIIPESIETLLRIITNGLPRAMFPLSHRRKGLTSLDFSSEYDVQDLLHALLRPWVSDIRPEEHTPSYAGSSTRMDFLLPDHKLVIETKIVRDKNHARKVGDELILDQDHYRAHPHCEILWCVIYDPHKYLENPSGIIADLSGQSENKKGRLSTIVLVI